LYKGIVSNKDTALPKPTSNISARHIALQLLYTLDTQQAYADVLLRQTLQGCALERRDRAFVTECVYGVIRWRGRIDWLLGHACRYPLEDLTPWIRNALRLGIYQCLWMTRVPHHAAVHETVALARHFGHAGTARLVNGVLRTVLRQYNAWHFPDATTQPAAHLAIAFSHPQWLVERWLQRYGWERTRALCEAHNRISGVTLRTNTLRTTTTALAQRLYQEGLQDIMPAALTADGLVVRGTDQLDALPSYQDGLFQVQDAGAMLVAPLCLPQSGQRVLDVCAAPGGKTTHLAQLMQDTGHIFACDVHQSRLRMLQHNICRLGLSSITSVVADAAGPLPFQQAFDRILVDAPCSGLGVLRRHPDIKWRKTAADLLSLSTLQQSILHHAQQLLAPAGLLVYSVCTNEPEETDDVVANFLACHPHLRLVDIDVDLERRLLVPAVTAGTLDLTPEQWATEGVFVARFRRCDTPPEGDTPW
jgi:16S rRNA (cytosine967-C5)-methyltransferase